MSQRSVAAGDNVAHELMLSELDRVRSSGLYKVYRWQIDIEGLTAFVQVVARGATTPVYLLAIKFDDFPERAPSYVFVDPDNRQDKDGAWPPGVQHGAQPPGICVPGTRECHEHYHKNDQQYQWSHKRYPVIETLEAIHKLVEKGA